jgi:hypothetical protein
MNRSLVFIVALLFAPTSSDAFEERNKAGLQVEVRGAYIASQFDLARNSNASYSGTDLGITVVPKARTRGLAIASAFMVDKRDMTNSANSSTIKEDFSGTVFALGGRIYSAELYVGAALVYSNFDLDYTENGTKTNPKYRAYGIRLESGLDVDLGGPVVLAPKLSYEVLMANSTSDEKNRRLKTFGLGLGLGIRF